jgi:hypothetical protein
MEFEQVRRFVEQHRAELEQAAGTAEFSRELDNLQRFWAAEEEPEQKLEETLRVLRKYPAVWSRFDKPEGVIPVTPSPAPEPSPVVVERPPPEAPAPLDTKLAYIRELVTGSIGVLIVLVALFCTVVALFRGVDMFPFLSGMVGVVLGYYFGRAPGDAQAAKAQVEAQDARKELGQVSDEVRSVLDSTAGARSRASGELVMDTAQLERLRRIAGLRHAM